MLADVESEMESVARSLGHQPGYRLVVLADDGSIQEVRLPAAVQWLSYAIPAALALALAGLLFLFGAYMHVHNVSQAQTAKIHHLTTTVVHGKKVIGTYREGLTLTTTVSNETAQLISTLKSAQSHLAHITGRQTPGAEGLSGILKVLEKIQGLLPTVNAGSH